MTTKHFKHIDFYTTNQVESGGFIGRLTGKNDLIFLRNKWQTEIDNSWAALMNMAHYLETCEDSIQTIVRFNEIARFRGEIHDTNVRSPIFEVGCIRKVIIVLPKKVRLLIFSQPVHKFSDSFSNLVFRCSPVDYSSIKT